MKIFMINGSPKPRNSNSARFLGELEKLLPAGNQIAKQDVHQTQRWQDSFAEAAASDVLVIAFPLYVDGIPSQMLRYLMELEQYLNSQAQRRGITVYAMLNCGFPEGIQNHLAIDMVKCWCRRARLTWGCAIGAGGGEMLGGMDSLPLGKGPKKSLGTALHTFAALVAGQTSGEPLYCNPNFPRFLFIRFANMGWNSQGRKNGANMKQKASLSR